MKNLIEMEQDDEDYNIDYGNNSLLVRTNERMTGIDNIDYSKLISPNKEESKPQETPNLEILNFEKRQFSSIQRPRNANSQEVSLATLSGGQFCPKLDIV